MVEPKSWNRYSYSRNDPIDRIDPLGLEDDDVIRLYAWAWMYHSGAGGTGVRPPQQRLPLDGVGSGEPMPLLDRKEIIAEAVSDVEDILKNKNDCSDFFLGSQAALIVLAAFAQQLQNSQNIGSIKNPDNSYNTSVGIRQTGVTTNVVDAPTGTRYRLFPNVNLNANGPFFRSMDIINPGRIGRRLQDIGSTAPGSRRSRALQILHELAHLMIDPKTGDPLIPNDGGDDEKSKENTKTIEKACKAQLKALSN